MSSPSNEKDAAEKPAVGGDEEGIPLHLLKNLRKGESAESGSSNGENNSDNSALVSIGNTSFGFNFDSEEQSPNNSEDSDGNNGSNSSNGKKRSKKEDSNNNNNNSSSNNNSDDNNNPAAVSGSDSNDLAPSPPESHRMESSDFKTSMSSLTGSSNSDLRQESSSSPTDSNNNNNSDNKNESTEGQSSSNDEEAHTAAAEDRVSDLKDIATSSTSAPPPDSTTSNPTDGNSNASSANAVAQPVASVGQQQQQPPTQQTQPTVAIQPPMPVSNIGSAMTVPTGDQKMQAVSGTPPNVDRKRKADEGDSSAGYHTDDEGRSVTMPSGASSVQGDDEQGKGKKKRLDEKKREERNMREKERSLRISRQITELRNLLSSGGVIVPKGTKSSVLTEAANYIRMLQQHQYRSELDRHQLIQQMQMIGNGAHGPQAAQAVRHVAAQNGVWSLGNFGDIPPKSAMSSFYQGGSGGKADQSSTDPTQHANKIDTSEYKYVFNSCGVGMAILNLGGAFIDCNQLFCQLSNYTKQQVCGMTVFNLTAREDLQTAFDLISQMISPPMESRDQEAKPIVLRGSMKNRNDIGLCISLVKGEDGIAKCFCATLIKNPKSPFDNSKPIPVSFDAIQTNQNVTMQKSDASVPNAAPAFTLG